VKWTTPAALKKQLERYWNKGALCSASVKDDGLFPLRLSLRQPSAKVMLDAFGALQDWVRSIQYFADQHALKILWSDINHRHLGHQKMPLALLLETPEQAAIVLGKRKTLQCFGRLYRQTIKCCPELDGWMLKRPLRLLELEPVWLRLLDICLWMKTHPNPRIYLRQVSLPEVDSKLIESHRQVLSELFDLLLPVYAINDDFSGVAGFAHRYGFHDKPLRIRLRPLDPAIRLLYTAGDQDVTLSAGAFGDLNVRPKSVFITENEINYLTFPDMPDSLIIFGAGYGFDALGSAAWLRDCALFYWGDIDTHGFAILDQLRAHLPKVKSLLMDRQTLLAHPSFWGHEAKQESRDLPRLTSDEASLYDDLRSNRLADGLRLEQERIIYSHVEMALNRLKQEEAS